MTGAYVRVMRAGRWENVEFDRLSDDELDAFAARSLAQVDGCADEAWKWAKFLARWIRDNVSDGIESERGGP